MEKTIFLLILLVTTNAYSKVFLVSWFDSFGASTTNNSQYIGEQLKTSIENRGHSVISCPLETKFGVAFNQLEDCINSNSNIDYVLSLGEAGCNTLKIETKFINLKKTYGPDNAGVEFPYGQEIVIDGDRVKNNAFNLIDSICSLDRESIAKLTISNNAGSFVCNELSYKYLNKYDIPFNFIHVASSSCGKINSLNRETAKVLKSLVLGLVGLNKNSTFPSSEIDYSMLRRQYKGRKCQMRILRKIKP